MLDEKVLPGPSSGERRFLCNGGCRRPVPLPGKRRFRKSRPPPQGPALLLVVPASPVQTLPPAAQARVPGGAGRRAPRPSSVAIEGNS